MKNENRKKNGEKAQKERRKVIWVAHSSIGDAIATHA